MPIGRATGRATSSRSGAAAGCRRSAASVVRVGRERVEVWRRDGIRVGDHPVPDAASCERLRLAGRLLDRRRSGMAVGLLRGHPARRWRRRGGRDRRGLLRRATGDGRGRSAAILVLGTNTYNAYNQWGGACLYSGAVKVSFDRPLERGYLRRPAAPDEVAYDGRMASLPDEPDEQHLQLQGYLSRDRLPAVVRFVRLAQLGAALRQVGGGRRASRSTTPSTPTSSSTPRCSTVTG